MARYLNAPATAAERTALGVSGLDTSAMHLATLDSVCARVDSAVMRKGVAPDRLVNLLIYQLGPAYVAMYPTPDDPALFLVDAQFEVATWFANSMLTPPATGRASSRSSHQLLGALLGGLLGAVTVFVEVARCHPAHEIPCGLGADYILSVAVTAGALGGFLIGSVIPAADTPRPEPR